ncbi:MAG: sulfurtransferase-like selenium metabolism protein YedF [Eubacteriales bacterium]|nr:sulfurtransferase-like selenium metabolism protein YedF [Eubacteriales bacterium]MDD4324523.1 sulfurtransferase-like selenium metabolism protein YedF [Eubacteriales bacterium]MDD4542010.1 sulfurtransferase-like selenium metabolism protein YedF [Eubacteriales bacterium]
MIIVEAEGLACPFPVIEAKKALRSSGSEDVLLRVDNEVAVGNLKRLATSMQREYSVKELSAELFEVTIKGETEGAAEASAKTAAVLAETDSEYIVQISSNHMGAGNDELGAILMKSFIYSLTEQDRLPVALVFYNTGVELTCEGSAVLEDLKTLEKAGVSLLSCGLCLDFLKLKEKLLIGEITNMYRIAELIRTYRTARP